MLWNEPNNLSHWDFELDPEWQVFSDMTRCASDAIRAVNHTIPRVLGGISPIDARFIARMKRQNVLEKIDVVAVAGLSLRWEPRQIYPGPGEARRIRPPD